MSLDDEMIKGFFKEINERVYKNTERIEKLEMFLPRGKHLTEEGWTPEQIKQFQKDVWDGRYSLNLSPLNKEQPKDSEPVKFVRMSPTEKTEDLLRIEKDLIDNGLITWLKRIENLETATLDLPSIRARLPGYLEEKPKDIDLNGSPSPLVTLKEWNEKIDEIERLNLELRNKDIEKDDLNKTIDWLKNRVEKALEHMEKQAIIVDVKDPDDKIRCVYCSDMEDILEGKL